MKGPATRRRPGTRRPCHGRPRLPEGASRCPGKECDKRVPPVSCTKQAALSFLAARSGREAPRTAETIHMNVSKPGSVGQQWANLAERRPCQSVTRPRRPWRFPPGSERINGPVAPLRPECPCLPGRTSGCGQAVENSIPDPRKPSEKTESGLDSKHGCFPFLQEGRLPRCPFRGLLGIHSRSGLPAR